MDDFGVVGLQRESARRTSGRVRGIGTLVAESEAWELGTEGKGCASGGHAVLIYSRLGKGALLPCRKINFHHSSSWTPQIIFDEIGKAYFVRPEGPGQSRFEFGRVSLGLLALPLLVVGGFRRPALLPPKVVSRQLARFAFVHQLLMLLVTCPR